MAATALISPETWFMAETPKDETYSEEETKARAEATLKVMLTTPHKPHKSGVPNRRKRGGDEQS
jgi:hypothetical protein